ncbi:CaiB/BaiF CoA transferase family protein [Thermodesulfobacteriota bacterium]
MAGPVEGLKVLELVRVGPGAYTTRMLADMGAEVLKIETWPQNKPTVGSGGSSADTRQAALNHLNRNKQSMALNLKSTEGRKILDELVAQYDVFVEGFRPGVTKRLGADYERLKKINPKLIYCSLSGYGQDGPYRDLPGHDINYISFGGALSLIGEADRPPTIPMNLVADYASAALHGIIGILLALYSRQNTEKGQYIDVSFLDGVISLTSLVPEVRDFFSDGSLPKRGESALSGNYPYYAVYETKDGKYFTLGCVEPWFWENMCDALGKEEWKKYAFQAEHFTTKYEPAFQKIKLEMEDIFKTRSRDEWFEFLKGHDICIGKVYTWDEVFDDPHVAHREMLIEIEDPYAGKVKQVGVPIKFSETPGGIRSLGPSLGQHTTAVLKELGYNSNTISEFREKSVVN